MSRRFMKGEIFLDQESIRSSTDKLVETGRLIYQQSEPGRKF